MTTVADIINQALRDVGVIGDGQTASAEDASNALDTLNQMLALWQVDGLKVYTLKSASVAATGAASYTVGLGGTFNRARPDNIAGAFWRSGGIDYPLEVVQSFNDFQLIAQKTLASIPGIVHYQATYPLGALRIYPVPASGDIHITIPEEFTEYTSVADDLALPSKYRLAVRYSLGELLSVSYPSAVGRMDITIQAAKARQVLKRSNLRIATLKQPSAVLPSYRGSIEVG